MFERCLYFNSNNLARVIEARWEAAYAPFDLSPAHAYLLRLVLAEPAITQKQIANILQREKSTVSRFIQVLEQRGLLTRERQGRETKVVATEAGRALHAELERVGDALYQSMCEALGEQVVQQFVRNMRRLSAALK